MIESRRKFGIVGFGKSQPCWDRSFIGPITAQKFHASSQSILMQQANAWRKSFQRNGWRAEAGSYVVVSGSCSHWTFLVVLICWEEVCLRKSISTNDTSMIKLRTRHPRIDLTEFCAKCSLLTVLGANLKTHIEGTCSNLIGLRWRSGKFDSCNDLVWVDVEESGTP